MKIKRLREKTKASYIDCKKALIEADNDIIKAEEILRNKGYDIISKQKNIKNGVISSYIHTGNLIGAMVEVRCQTDFAAKTEEFLQFAKDIAMQVAAMKPKYISSEDIPLTEYADEFNSKYKHLLKNEEHKFMEQWVSQVCLLRQPYIKNSNKTINDLLAELANKTNENCQIVRFNYWEVGEVLKKREEEEAVGYNDIMKKFIVPSTIILSLFFIFIIIGLMLIK